MRAVDVLGLPPGAVLAAQVRVREAEGVVGEVRRILVEVVRGRPGALAPEPAELRIVLRGRPREVLLAESDAGGAVADAHAVDAVREEEPPLRVHQPPLAVHLLRAEEARRLELRPSRPAAEAVGLGNGRGAVLREPGVLVDLRARQLRLVVHLARPLPGQSSCMNWPKRSTNGRNVFADSTFGGGTPTPSAVTRNTLKPLATPSWQKKMWKEVVWRMLNPPPASSSAAGRPFMPSSFSGSSSVHGRPRTLATISPFADGMRFQDHGAAGALSLHAPALHAEVYGARLVRRVAHRHDEAAEAREVGLALHEVHAHAGPAGLHAGRHAHGTVRERGDRRVALRAHHGVGTGPQRLGPRPRRRSGRQGKSDLLHVVHPFFGQRAVSALRQPFTQIVPSTPSEATA